MTRSYFFPTCLMNHSKSYSDKNFHWISKIIRYSDIPLVLIHTPRMGEMNSKLSRILAIDASISINTIRPRRKPTLKARIVG